MANVDTTKRWRSAARVILALLFLCLAQGPISAQGIIATLGGKDFPFAGEGKPASSVPVGSVPSIAVDTAGNLYSVIENFLIVKTGPDGILHAVAGNGIPASSGDGGPATSASLAGPLAVTVDASGNIFVAEAFSHRIRKITSAGIVSTFAGNGAPDTSGDGGPALKAGLGLEIWSMVFDAAGNLYFSQRDEHLVRKIDVNGIITTVAGTGQPGFSGDGGPAAKATLTVPVGLAFDAKGNLLIGDTGNFRVRSISPDGIISTVAGGGLLPGDGISASAAFVEPLGVAGDAAGNIYLTDYYTARVRRVDTKGVITTVAGSGLRGFAGDGGPALAAAFAAPFALGLDTNGNIFVDDFAGSRVRRIDKTGTISTFVGNGLYKPEPDNVAATDTAIRFPWGIAAAPDGGVLVGERLGQKIRRIGPDGIVSTIAGTGDAGYSGDGGPATQTTIALPYGVAVDASGAVYFTQETDFRVRKVSTTGIITTVAGNGIAGLVPVNGVLATNSSLAIPEGLAFDKAGNMYISDSGQNVVRKVAPSGTISTVVGNGSAGFSGDGGPALAASLNEPTGLAVDTQGNLYIADRGNLRIRRLGADGTINTVAGNGAVSFAGEGGLATNASLSPDGIAFDAAGTLYVADPDNQRILKITSAGIITTFAGTGQPGSAGDGGLATLASMNTPHGVAVDAKGNVYIADTGNGRVRVVLAAPATFSVSTHSLSFTGSYTGAVTQPQSVQISGSLPGLPFATSASTTDGANWLLTNLPNGTMPSPLEVTADPSSLPPGVYHGTITVTATGAQPPVQTIAVDLTVGPAIAPNLSVKSDPLSFSITQGQGALTAALPVTNSGGGSIVVKASVTTQSGGSWLSASPSALTISANSPGSITITADPSGLAPGTYLGQISIQGSTGQSVVVPATLILSAAKQKLLLTSSGFTFEAVAGGGVTPPQHFGIANAGDGVLNWTATPGPPWLTVSSSSGSSAAGLAAPQVLLNAQSGSLTPGVYYDRVTIAAPDVDNAPQIVSAVLNVLPADQSPGPIVQPTGLVFTATAGGVSPSSQTVNVYNPGSTPLSFNSVRLTLDGNNWFVHLPSTGSVTPDAPLPIIVQPNLTGLGPGVYAGVITLIFGDQSVRVVNLLFVVAPASTNAATFRKGLIPAAATSCVPGKLALLATSIAGGFISPVGWPTPLEVSVVDDCAAPLTAGSVAVTFNNGDPPLLLTPLGGGAWSGTWTPRSSSTSALTVTFSAQSSTGLTGQLQVSGQAQTNTGAPLLRPTAIVNAAYPAAPVPLAPGSLVSLFGLGLAASPQTAQGYPLPLTLAGTSVVMAGRELPLLYAADGQINTVIPYDIAFNTRQQLIVDANGKLTSPELVSIAPAQPVVFTADGSGSGQGLVYRTVGGVQILADSQNPATAGDEILIKATGLGAVNPSFDAGTIPGTAAAPPTTNAVSLTIGGINANVVSAALSPDVAGLYWVQATVPAGIPAGNAVPIVLSTAGESSPVVSIAIK